MAFWRTYFHLVWATKKRLPLIVPEIEPNLWELIRKKAGKIGGIPHAIGGIEDHIHLVVSIPPKISVSDFVGQVKGASAHSLNHGPLDGGNRFTWQDGFGVFSMGERQLEKAVHYVRNQKERHRKKDLIPLLEAIAKNDVGPERKD